MSGGAKKTLAAVGAGLVLLLAVSNILVFLAVAGAACGHGSAGASGDVPAPVATNSADYRAPEHSSDPIAERTATFMEAIALDNSHGYSQARRDGNPDYDCSSAVFFAVRSAGVNLPGSPFTTYNEGRVLSAAGFRHLTWSGDYRQAKSQLMRGDIVVNPVEHTEVYVGGGLFAGAHHACPGGIDDGRPGDQCAGTGDEEIGVGSYLDPGLTEVYRHDPNAQAAAGGDVQIAGAAQPAQCQAQDDVQPAVDGPDGSNASAEQAKRIAKGMLPSYFPGTNVDQEYGCLVAMWTHESGWNLHATNPSSGAYGIPQSLPGSKMASAGPDWHDNATTQIKWGLQYVKERYSTPCGAWGSWQQKGWY